MGSPTTGRGSQRSQLPSRGGITTSSLRPMGSSRARKMRKRPHLKHSGRSRRQLPQLRRPPRRQKFSKKRKRKKRKSTSKIFEGPSPQKKGLRYLTDGEKEG